MYVVRKFLGAREGAPANSRVNPDTGEVETTMDGGTTWVPDPNSDPRQNPAYNLPPNTAPDVRCAAAAGMVENVRRVITGAAGGTTVASIATLLLALLILPGIGWMYAAFILFANAFVIAGSAAVLAAFDEDVYTWLLCAFRKELDADGRITEAGLAHVQELSASQGFDVLVPDMLYNIFQLHKFVGFNNAGVVYADPDAECECGWCYNFDFELDDGGFVVNPSLPYGTWISGQGWTSVPGLGGRVLFLTQTIPTATVTKMEIEFCAAGNVRNNGTVQLSGNVYLGWNFQTTCPVIVSFDGDEVTGTVLTYGAGNGSGGGDGDGTDFWVTRLTLWGVGDNPFGEDNC